MKIKTKLIISFLIILLVPMVLSGVTFVGFQTIQRRAIHQTQKSGEGYHTFYNSLQMLSRQTAVDFQELQRIAEEEPDRLEDVEYLEIVQEKLSRKFSYLVVKKNGQLLFAGGEDNDEVVENLPVYGSYHDPVFSTYLDHEDEILVRQADFYFSNGAEGSAYIVTTSRSVAPEVRKLVSQIIITIVIILICTAIILIGWLYRSIIEPLTKLQVAAENIKEGNLDFEMDISGMDEIGELAVTFEEMRQRLKDNAEEKVTAEKENRMLISNIAHDLKTPITSVKGYSEGILDGVANTPDKLERYVRTIYNKSIEMENLINELTLYSKIETNRIPYNYECINVNAYFGDVAEEIGIDLEETGIKLSYDNRVDDSVEIIADPEQLHRVISNIIGNSAKYMDKKEGHIDIRIKDVGDYIQVEMEDNGKGIAQKDLPYIFDRFYRTDESRNSSTGGSGIGLSIVKKIIEDHGGKIWASSKENTGTCMSFVIRKHMEHLV